MIIDKDGSGCKHMIISKKRDELKLLYKCFVRNETNLPSIIRCLNDYIQEFGKKIVEDQTLCQDPCALTQKLLEFKNEIDELISYAFNFNIKFEKARDSSFQDFMNINQNTPAYIANFTDKELRQGI